MASLVHYDSDENIVGAADPARAWHEGPVEASALEVQGTMHSPCIFAWFRLVNSTNKKNIYIKNT